jgi:hypothetical protein
VSADRLVVRLLMLRQLPANHDNEGAAAPGDGSFDAALAFAPSVDSVWRSGATVDDDGYAVIEFEGANGSFAAITFYNEGRMAECYSRVPGRPSRLEVMCCDAPTLLSFLEEAARLSTPSIPGAN